MTAKFYKGIDLKGNTAVNAADPSNPTDVANKQYVDNVAAGLNWKQRVRAASTANMAIASAVINGASMDGVTLATGDRVLLKNQSAGAENGIYIVAASGAAARAPDANTSAEVRNMVVGVESGTVNGDKYYQLMTDNPTLGTTALVYDVLILGGSSYTAGAGLTESPAGTFNVGQGTGITVNADDVAINTSVVVRKFAADCVATTNPQNFDHGLGTDVTVDVWEGSEKIYPDITKSSTSGGRVTVDLGVAPTVGQYRVVVHG